MINSPRNTQRSSTVLLVLVFAIFGLHTHAQKLARTDFESINKKVVFPPVVQLLSKENHYKWIFPQHLTYHHDRGFMVDEFFGHGLASGINARYHELKADYIFEIVMNGMENIQTKAPRRQTSGYSYERGIIKDISYNFPCSLIVKNKKGEVVKKMEIFSRDKVFNVEYDRGIFTGVVTPFPTAISADSNYDFNRNAVHKFIEARTAREGFGYALQSLQYMFSDYETWKLNYPIGIIKAKKREADYSFIDSVNAQLKLAVITRFDSSEAKAANMFTSCLKLYDAILKSGNPAVDRNVVDIVHFNMSLCCLLLKDFNGAWEHFGLATMKEVDSGDFYKQDLRQRIELFQFRKSVEVAGIQ